MSMRITTKAIMQGYNRDLTNALNNWNKAQNKVLTQRNFNTVAENPAGANRAFKLRRQFRNNNMQLELTKQSETLLEQASSSAMQISKIMTETVNPDILKAVNATNSAPDVRKAYAASLRGMRDSIVLAANSQISGRFVFSGASTKEVPFVLDEETGKLTYRGIDVDATEKDLYLDDNGNPVFYDANGERIEEDAYDAIEKTIVYKDANGNALVQGTDYDTVDADGNLIKHHTDEEVQFAAKEFSYSFQKADGTPLVEGVDYTSVATDGTPALFGTPLTAADYDASKTVKTPVFKDAEGNVLEYDKLDPNDPDTGVPYRTYDEIIEYGTKETQYTLKKDGNVVSEDVSVTIEDAEGNVIEHQGMLNQKQALDMLAKETLYVDLGFGLEEDVANGTMVSTSAFNAALPGISVLGYGLDENGISNNVVSILTQLADELEKEEFSEENYGKLMDKYSECIDQITDFESSLGTKQKFLEGTVTRLEQYNDSINNRIVSIEQVDMAEAISTYTWMGYAYNAALKVGTDIVSNSLLDYMK